MEPTPSKLGPFSFFMLGSAAAIGYAGSALAIQEQVNLSCPETTTQTVMVNEVQRELVDPNALLCRERLLGNQIEMILFLLISVFCTSIFFRAWGRGKVIHEPDEPSSQSPKQETTPHALTKK